MPANWDPYQNINSGRVEWPTGPMTLNPGFDPKWVDAWVVQGGGMGPGDTWTGPCQSTTQSSGWMPGTWTADALKWINGSFQAGPAIGVSILASRNSTAGTYEYHWWFDVVVLY